MATPPDPSPTLVDYVGRATLGAYHIFASGLGTITGLRHTVRERPFRVDKRFRGCQMLIQHMDHQYFDTYRPCMERIYEWNEQFGKNATDQFKEAFHNPQHPLHTLARDVFVCVDVTKEYWRDVRLMMVDCDTDMGSQRHQINAVRHRHFRQEARPLDVLGAEGYGEGDGKEDIVYSDLR